MDETPPRDGERGRDQLDRKLRMLIGEQERQRMRAKRCREDLAVACADAHVWALRASLLGGEDALRHATPTFPAEVELTWASEMGLRYPSGATVRAPVGTSTLAADNAAVLPAVDAARSSLEAAARSAAANEAVRRIDAEVAVTRRRLRALDRACLPALHHALATLELALEQGEQEDGTRLRRAASSLREKAPR